MEEREVGRGKRNKERGEGSEEQDGKGEEEKERADYFCIARRGMSTSHSTTFTPPPVLSVQSRSLLPPISGASREKEDTGCPPPTPPV